MIKKFFKKIQIKLKNIEEFRVRRNNIKNKFEQLFYHQSSGAYELLITGESLAGGVACVLSIMLKQLHPKLHCYVYSPPFAVFRWVGWEGFW